MPQPPVSRRDFTKRLAAGAAVVPLSACHAQEERDVTSPKSSNSKQDAPDDVDKDKSAERDDAALTAQAEMLAKIVAERYPDGRLNDRVLMEIRDDIEGDLARSRQLSEVPLSNADEPGFVFAAFRHE